jgi:tetratricopeptide (TPR) repeat protein
MRAAFISILKVATLACALCTASPHGAFATGADSSGDPQADPMPCIAATAARDADNVIAICSALLDHERISRADRIKALIARAGAYDRKDQIDRAIGDYDTVLRLDPRLADIFNARGELWRRKGDRPRALHDFSAAVKLNPNHPTARSNLDALVQEVQRLGALMAIYNRPGLNCLTARRVVEKAICARPELARLEREIDAVNAKVVRDASRDSPQAGRAMQQEQSDFIARRDAGFGRPDYDLQKAMRERLDHLLAVGRY